MNENRAVTQIITTPIPPLKMDDTHSQEGAELIFHGRVRDQEKGRKISALFYEHYSGMAEQELQALAEEILRDFPISSIECIHRVGEIPVGEISMRVVIWSTHRAEGLAAMDQFISRLKKQVPIWKQPVFSAGS